MDVACVSRPFGPFLISVSQKTTIATAIEVQGAAARDLRTEIAVACHEHIEGLALRQRDGRIVRLVGTGSIVATDVDLLVVRIGMRQRHQQQYIYNQRFLHNLSKNKPKGFIKLHDQDVEHKQLGTLADAE